MPPFPPFYKSWLLAAVASASAFAVEPVEFIFNIAPNAEDPFAREISADVVTPSQHVLRLPAYFAGEGHFAVRARASERGEYALQAVVETKDKAAAAIAFEADPGRTRTTVEAVAALPQVDHVAGLPARFYLANGDVYTPVGANVAWPEGDRERFHSEALKAFHREGLNWMRVWMAHWSGYNLDWFPPDLGTSPALGTLDSRVAARWDKIVAAAETEGVYLQIVLQHHGQYSTQVNSNWAANPWNAAQPGGFLKTPGEFFTSSQARALTARKYRYIVARWGYSPAVLAWELFNEVHWTDPIHIAHDENTVAQWHAEMAAVIRRFDVYRHFVTTSTDNLRSPSYSEMDYAQPHLYAANILAGVREFERGAVRLDRPVFYGEFGDDHMGLARAQREAGVAIVPAVWASLMGESRNPAQPWMGAQLLAKKRLGELGAVARFLAGTHFSRQED